jgi:hypothetical protein
MSKKTNHASLFSGFLILLGAILLGSCSAERKLATEFYKNRKNNVILLIPADFVYKYNLKAFEIEGAETMEQSKLDSLLLTNSLFMQYLSDSIFLETFMNSFISGLRSKGVRVYLQPDTDLFFENPHEKFIVNVAQLMLEEYVELLFDPDDIEYSFMGDYYLNVISLSSWFEISGVNETEPQKRVVFAEMTMNDQFDGRLRFYPFTGNVHYTYSVDSVSVSDIYLLASEAGRQNAGYLFDFLMNRYIDRNIPPGEARSVYYRYDFNTRGLRQAADNRFVIIE